MTEFRCIVLLCLMANN